MKFIIHNPWWFDLNSDAEFCVCVRLFFSMFSSYARDQGLAFNFRDRES